MTYRDRNYAMTAMIAALYAASRGLGEPTRAPSYRDPNDPAKPVRRDPEPRPPARRYVRDPEREAAAQAKRDRKNAKRAALLQSAAQEGGK